MRCLVGTFLQREGRPLPALGVPCERSPGRQAAPRLGTKGLSSQGTSCLQLSMKEPPDPGFPVPLTPAGRRPLTLCCPCSQQAHREGPTRCSVSTRGSLRHLLPPRASVWLKWTRGVCGCPDHMRTCPHTWPGPGLCCLCPISFFSRS